MGKHIPRIERLENLKRAEEIRLAFEQSLRKSANQNNIFKQVIEVAKSSNLDDTATDSRYQVIQRTIRSFTPAQKAMTLAAFEEIYKQYGSYCNKWFRDDDYIMALLVLCRYRKSWVRDLSSWKPKHKKSYGRFLDLVSHLLTQYKAPAFLYHSFFHAEDHVFLPLFIDLASGKSMKMSMTLPLALNKKMQFYFIQTPEGFRVKEALRWAQVRALEGDEWLAHQVAYSVLARKGIRNEGFWLEFLRIVVNGGMFCFDKFEEVYEYLSHKLRQEPSYSLKGRTLASLIRHSEEWQKENKLMQSIKHDNLSWERSKYDCFTMTEGDGMIATTFELHELTSRKKLIEEGRLMRNCVATYATACSKNSTRIFSLRQYKAGIEDDRLATIEVDITSHRIVQAKYKFNKPISAKTKKMLSKWAMDNGLLVAKYL